MSRGPEPKRYPRFEFPRFGGCHGGKTGLRQFARYNPESGLTTASRGARGRVLSDLRVWMASGYLLVNARSRTSFGNLIYPRSFARNATRTARVPAGSATRAWSSPAGSDPEEYRVLYPWS